MSRKAMSSCKKALAKVIGVVLIVMMSITMCPSLIKAETSKKVQYFVVKKEWQNDLESKRPEKVAVTITTADGTVVDTKDLTAPNWEASFSLPAYDGEGNQITYYAHEDATGLDAYLVSNPEQTKLPIRNSIIVEDNTDREVVSTYTLNEKSGFDAVPEGNVVIDQPLQATDKSLKNLPAGFSLGEYSVYTKPKENTPDEARARIKYTGDLGVGENNIPGEIVMEWDEAATDYMTGEKYNVRLTLSNIKIFSPVAHEGANVAVLANYTQCLHMQAYVTEYNDDIMKNIVGVHANIKFEIFNQSGSPANGFTQVYITDLDTGNSARNYYDHMADYEADHNYDFSSSYDNYFGVGQDYAESVILTGGVASEIYIQPKDESNPDNSSWLEHDSSYAKYAAVTGTPNWDNDPRVSLEFLASSASFSYSWSGSDCGTAINTVSPSDIPAKGEFTNTIINTSSRYHIEYYYQKEGESGAYYSETPDYPADPVSTEVMVKPGTYVEASAEDKTPSELRGMPADGTYVLDEAEGVWSGTTSTTDNPLILKVYFKKAYRVTYHDNVGDVVWNAQEKQNNPGLDYGTETPKFNAANSEADAAGNPVRAGYNFKGWSVEPESEILESIPEKVTEDADYWAHWEPRTDTKYKVEYYYEVNGSYRVTPDYTSDFREGTTDSTVSITEEDKIPLWSGYHLNSGMTLEWTGVVLSDGSLVLKVYFKSDPAPAKNVPSYTIPLTGVE